MRAEEQREARRRQTARYEALGHMERQRRRQQAPLPEPKTINRLEMGLGRGGVENKGKQEGAGEQRSGQPSGGPQ